MPTLLKILPALAISTILMASVAQADEKFKAVTTFTVIADMAENVAGDHAEVVSITKPGAEIHNYQPTPKDIIKAQDADLVIWNGLNLELWFEQFFENLRDVPSVVVTDGIEPMGIASGPYSGKPNPHAWMSPSDAMIYVDNIAKRLQSMTQKMRRTILRMLKTTRPKLKQWLLQCVKNSTAFQRTNVGWSRPKGRSAI